MIIYGEIDQKVSTSRTDIAQSRTIRKNQQAFQKQQKAVQEQQLQSAGSHQNINDNAQSVDRQPLLQKKISSQSRNQQARQVFGFFNSAEQTTSIPHAKSRSKTNRTQECMNQTRQPRQDNGLASARTDELPQTMIQLIGQRGQKKYQPSIVQDSKAFPADFFGTAQKPTRRQHFFSPEIISRPTNRIETGKQQVEDSTAHVSVTQHFSNQTTPCASNMLQNSISYAKKAGFNSSCGAPPMFIEQPEKAHNHSNYRLKKFGADRRRSNEVQLNSADGPGRPHIHGQQFPLQEIQPVEFASQQRPRPRIGGAGVPQVSSTGLLTSKHLISSNVDHMMAPDSHVPREDSFNTSRAPLKAQNSRGQNRQLLHAQRSAPFNVNQDYPRQSLQHASANHLHNSSLRLAGDLSLASPASKYRPHNQDGQNDINFQQHARNGEQNFIQIFDGTNSFEQPDMLVSQLMSTGEQPKRQQQASQSTPLSPGMQNSKGFKGQIFSPQPKQPRILNPINSNAQTLKRATQTNIFVGSQAQLPSVYSQGQINTEPPKRSGTDSLLLRQYDAMQQYPYQPSTEPDLKCNISQSCNNLDSMDATLAGLQHESLPIERSEGPQVAEPHRDVETPCFVKDTVRDGFFQPVKDGEKRNKGKTSKESIEETTKKDQKEFPFGITEIDSCEDNLTAVGDSCDLASSHQNKPKNSLSSVNRQSRPSYNYHESLFDNISSSGNASGSVGAMQMAQFVQKQQQNSSVENFSSSVVLQLSEKQLSTPPTRLQDKVKKLTFGNSEQLKKHSDIIAFRQMARLANRAFVPPATAANGSPQKSLQQRIQDGRRMARQSTTQQ